MEVSKNLGGLQPPPPLPSPPGFYGPDSPSSNKHNNGENTRVKVKQIKNIQYFLRFVECDFLLIIY